MLTDEFFPGDLVHLRRAIDTYWKAGRRTQELPIYSLRLLAKAQAGKRWPSVEMLLDQLTNTPLLVPEAVEGHLLEYIRTEGLRRLALDITEELDRGTADPVGVRRRLDELCSAHGVNGDRSVDYASGPRTPYTSSSAKRISTGVSGLDALFGGGPGPGELALCIAPYQGGKTAFLVNLGAVAALAARRVLHLSMELSLDMTMMRYDMRISGASMKKLNRRKIGEARRRVAQAGGALIIRDCAHERVTPSRVEGIIDRDGPFDLVVLDYADLMRADRIGEHRLDSTEVYADLRRIANARGVPIWTASQATRSASKDSEHWSGADVAEDINKARIADYIVLLKQSRSQREMKLMTLEVDKTRMAADLLSFPVHMDYSTMTLSELPGQEDTDVTEVEARRTQARRAVREAAKARSRSFHS